MAEPISAVVVDDEPIARAGMRRLLAAQADIHVAGEAGDGRSAVELIQRLRPELLLLDVQMPEMDGFEVLQQIGPDAVKAVVFVTAYDRFAIRAFEVQALDYVLKPFDDERFAAVIERARRHIRRERDGDLAGRLAALLDQFSGDAPPAAARQAASTLSRFVVREGGRVFFQPVDEVDWIEAADYYARLHVGSRSYLLRESLSALEEQLDATRFVRVHRSAIINLERVLEIRPDWKNRPTVVLLSGTRIPISRSRRDVLERALKGGA